VGLTSEEDFNIINRINIRRRKEEGKEDFCWCVKFYKQVDGTY
jgi:hypothetical protein